MSLPRSPEGAYLKRQGGQGERGSLVAYGYAHHNCGVGGEHSGEGKAGWGVAWRWDDGLGVGSGVSVGESVRFW